MICVGQCFTAIKRRDDRRGEEGSPVNVLVPLEHQLIRPIATRGYLKTLHNRKNRAADYGIYTQNK